jgi:hypothetical protein
MCFKCVGYDLRGSDHCYDRNYKLKNIISDTVYRNVYVLSPAHITLNLAPVNFSYGQGSERFSRYSYWLWATEPFISSRLEQIVLSYVLHPD